MRISDWSSDVCSSDLLHCAVLTSAITSGLALASILVALLLLLGFGSPAAALLAFAFAAALLPIPFAATLPAALRRIGPAAARAAHLGVAITLLLLLPAGLVAILRPALLLLTILPVPVLATSRIVLILILVGHCILHRGLT